MKRLWPIQVKIPWSSILAIQYQASNGIAYFLHPNIPWSYITSSYHEQSNSSFHEIQHHHIPWVICPSFHEIQNLNLPWVFQLKPPWYLLSQATLEIYYLKLMSTLTQTTMSLVLSHQVYYTRRDHTTHIQANPSLQYIDSY